MSQPHNLQPEDLPLENLQPAAPLTAVPTRTTDHTAPTHPDASEAPMATPTSPSTEPTPQPEPTTPVTTTPTDSAASATTGTAAPTAASTGTTTATGAGTASTAAEASGAAVGADVMGMLAAVARPRLASVGGLGEHTVPATARYAGELTDGALALRLQAITRLGVVSAPRHLSSIDAFVTPQPHTALAPAPEEHVNPLTAVPEEQESAALAHGGHGGAVVAPAPDEQSSGAVVPVEEEHGGVAVAPSSAERGGLAVAPAPEGNGDAACDEGLGGAGRSAVAGGGEEGPKLSVVPAVVGVAHSVAAPGQPDGARASLKTADTTSKATGTAGVVGQDPRVGAGPALPEVRVWGARMAQAVSEVLAGDRPISQLVRFTDDVVFMELNRRVRMLGMNSTAGMRGSKEKSTVRSVRVFMPEPCIAEVAAHVRHGQRSRAVAFRLEIRRNRWVCTALELG